jgi:hypothetical protein
MMDGEVPRRELVAAAVLAGLLPGVAWGSRLDGAETIVTLADRIGWQTREGYPERSVEAAALFGSRNARGIYYELIKWFPGYMSAPHRYVSDRLCVVVSGTWWVNSRADFDPAQCVAVPAGSFVHRVAHTPHYDGVVAGAREPAVIAICGIAPVEMRMEEPGKPGWRRVG